MQHVRVLRDHDLTRPRRANSPAPSPTLYHEQPSQNEDHDGGDRRHDDPRVGGEHAPSLAGEPGNFP
jgi:hypothetical protein